MKDIKLESNDIVLDYVNGTNEVIQSGKIILSTRKGEFDLEPKLGMDRSSLLGKKFSKELVASDVYDALSQEDRFSNVHTTVSTNFEGRSATINLTATVNKKQIEVQVDYA